MSTHTNDINLSMVDNGLDFILKSLQTIQNADEDLKYSLLNLHAGIQLLLKEILYQQDESLIFQNIEDYEPDKLRTGNFSSVNYKTLLKRLKDECDIELDKQLTDMMTWLKTERNKAEHYQFVVSSDVLKSNIVVLFSHLMPFIMRELIETDYLNSDNERFTNIRDYLNRFDDYIQERLNQIKEMLSGVDVPLQCPLCNQVTVDFTDNYTSAQCYFCEEQFDSFAEEYVDHFVDFYSHVKDGGDYPLNECPECEQEFFICLDEKQFICLNCGVRPTADKITTCNGPYCGGKYMYRSWSDEDIYDEEYDQYNYGEHICDFCIEEMHSRD